MELYRFTLVHGKNVLSIDDKCAIYLIHLTDLCNTVIRIEENITTHIICNESNSTMVEGLSNISNWLSYRQCQAAVLLQLLCGSNKLEKRALSRAIKRIISWYPDWSDYTASVIEQVQNPLCGLILLDKLLRHRKITYFLETSTPPILSNHLSVADILLTMLISSWLRVHHTESALVMDTIPAVIKYIQRIRKELRVITLKQCGGLNAFTDIFDDDLEGQWFDRMSVEQERIDVFRFTSKASRIVPVSSQLSPSAAAVVIDHDHITQVAQSLIDQIDWRSSGIEFSTVAPILPTSLSDTLWVSMQLPEGRQGRKVQQITSLVAHILPLLPPGGTAMEFCSGGGYVGIPLAFLRPDCRVVLTDMNSVSLQFARQRVQALGLQNVEFLRTELSSIETQFFHSADESKQKLPVLLESFDVGIALHACGSATDATLRICMLAKAAFVVSPCCYGFLQHYSYVADTQACGCCEQNIDITCVQCSTTGTTSSSDSLGTPAYPQSTAFRAQGWTPQWFAALCSRADRTFWAHDTRSVQYSAQGALAMRTIDADRLLRAQEQGWEVYADFMQPPEASLKNHILIGNYNKKATI